MPESFSDSTVEFIDPENAEVTLRILILGIIEAEIS
jgi:hypothetical protein